MDIQNVVMLLHKELNHQIIMPRLSFSSQDESSNIILYLNLFNHN